MPMLGWYNTPLSLKCAVQKEKDIEDLKKQTPLSFQLAQLNAKADTDRNV